MRYWYQAFLMALISTQCLAEASASKMIMANYHDWSIYSPNYHVADIDAARLTHLVYKSAILTPEATLGHRDDYADLQHFSANLTYPARGSLRQLQQLKHAHPHLRVIISIDSETATWQHLAQSDVMREHFLHSVMNFIEHYQFDGVEINWTSLALESMTLAQQQGLARTLKQLKKRMSQTSAKQPQPLQLSLLIPWRLAPLQKQLTNAMFAPLDYVIVDTLSPLQEQGFPPRLAPIFSPYGHDSIAHSVAWLKEQIKPHKIILTIPSHGLKWQAVNAQSSASWQLSQGSWDNRSITGVTQRHEVESMQQQSLTSKQSHETSDAISGQIITPNGKHLLLFESSASLHDKLNFILDQDLAGIALSSLHNDNGATSLLSRIHRHFAPVDAAFTMMATWFYSDPIRITLSILVGLAAMLYGLWRLLLRSTCAQLLQHQQLLTLAIDCSVSLMIKLQRTPLKDNQPEVYSYLAEQVKQLAQLNHAIKQRGQQTSLLYGVISNEATAPVSPPDHSSVHHGLQVIEAFQKHALTSNSLTASLETMLRLLDQYYPEFEVVIVDKDTYFAGKNCDTLIQEGRQIAQLFQYRFIVPSAVNQDLPEIHILQTLASQLDVAKKHIKQLLASPRLLAELHLVATSQPDILFIQADQGYSGIFIHPKKAKSHIIMRLSHLKQYFEEHYLVQVHRSYLVNPAKVTRAKPLHKNKYVLIMPGQQLPIGHSYLAQLKLRFPDWFNQKRGQ
ncbi:glycosyl hydrolase family 18 protein [Motilimonas pumila]|uniref:chitinase n=1 Tax=Motilimonas pumila TaxID=2303987 RepID=A0A418YIG5_9GAMM|nr:glycosyl hydrolase family 18 protein [Motilimonas pumila]RJG50428.1 hypothetical protein D1Z90_02820 [Motilimonas pumila]